MRGADFSIEACVKAGMPSTSVLEAGFPAKDVLKSGVLSLADMVKGGFSLPELRGAGVTAKDLHSAGVADVSNFVAAGFPAKEVSGFFSPKALKGAGYSLSDLVVAIPAVDLKGLFNAQDLKQSGGVEYMRLGGAFSLKELREDAGVQANELKRVGVSAAELVKEGFEPAAIKKAYKAEELKSESGHIMSPSEMRSGELGVGGGVSWGEGAEWCERMRRDSHQDPPLLYSKRDTRRRKSAPAGTTPKR